MSLSERSEICSIVFSYKILKNSILIWIGITRKHLFYDFDCRLTQQQMHGPSASASKVFSKTTLFNWFTKLKCKGTSLRDKDHKKCQKTAVVPANIYAVHKMIIQLTIKLRQL